MLPSSDKDLRQLLGPSESSAEGYLGNDTRSPETIVEEDRQELARLEVSAEKIAKALRDAYIKAERALGNPVKLSATLTIAHEEARGRIPSPFPGDGTFQKGQAKLADASSGQTFLITPLSLHLIEKYGFFQGKGSPYRIEPEQAARFLQEMAGKK
jgi:hypothetical protein